MQTRRCGCRISTDLPARPARGSVGSVNTLSPGKRALGIALGILLIPAVLWLFYGLFAFVDRYLFRL
jgi:hypothetical protein